MLHLWQNDSSFRRWCESTIFPAELAKLVEKILQSSERATYGLQDVLSQCAPHARLVSTTKEGWADQLKDRQLFVASSNTPKKIGDCLTADEELPATFGPLVLRTISLPKDVVNSLRKTVHGDTASQESNQIKKPPLFKQTFTDAKPASDKHQLRNKESSRSNHSDYWPRSIRRMWPAFRCLARP